MAANSSRPPGQDHHNEKKASAVLNLTPDITPALNAPKPSIRHAPPPGLSNLPPNTLLYPIELPGINFMNADAQRGAVFAAAAAAAAVLSGISPDAIDTTPHGIAAPCNRPDCLVCSTFNNPTSALHELPQINIGEFWIRHIENVFGARSPSEEEEFKSCEVIGDRVLNLAESCVDQQKQLIEQMKEINRNLDKALENIDDGNSDSDSENVLHDKKTDKVIVDALAQLRSGNGHVNSNGERIGDSAQE